MPRLIKLCRVDRRCGAFAISSAAVWSRWEKTVCPRRFNVMKARKVGGVGAILTMWQPDGSVKTESTKSRYTTSSECGCCMVSRPRRTPQRVTLVPSRRTYRRREVTREVAKLSADRHRRRAASTRLSPVPGLATFLRRVPCFRTAFLLLAAFVTRRFALLAAIAAAPYCTFPPHSSVRPCAGQSSLDSLLSLSRPVIPRHRMVSGLGRVVRWPASPTDRGNAASKLRGSGSGHAAEAGCPVKHDVETWCPHKCDPKR
jgi:hypothetical protein